MSLAYEKSGDWRALGVVAGLHALAVFALLNVEPVAQAMGLQQPLMVSLLTPKEPEPPQAQPQVPPKPLPAKPLVREVQPELPPPLLAVREAMPSPVTVAPLPAVLPPPPPAIGPVAAPAPIAQSPAPIVAPRFDADYLDNPAPVYPTLSRRMGEFGRVLLRVQVTPEGGAAQIEVRESSGFERLDKAARDTVLRWRFVPARQGDRGVAAWVLVPISFSLRS